ncbi:uncharacterized protein LOC132047475 [Lycium ferocissimum]|uniref:uncharacterized protein LOC132047475 n=1 Tax=Lycium ferocissimum TaxID=112874 RepID=UPI0028167993|nr:uncharacterized protein LOC132047475 [Lycium ferocissimum]
MKNAIGNQDICISAIYAKCTTAERRDLWESLEEDNLKLPILGSLVLTSPGAIIEALEREFGRDWIEFVSRSMGSRIQELLLQRSSIASYLSSLLPKGTLKLIEKHLANFFWGSSQDHKNYHWSSWVNHSVPCDEEGIGTKNMIDFSNTLAMKRWRRFRTSNSLWANIVRNKYCIRSHVVGKKWALGDSHAWKPMLQVSEEAEKHMLWQVNFGTSFFWWDNWTYKGPLAHQAPELAKSSKLLVKQFIKQGRGDLDKLRRTLPNHLCEIIRKIEIGNPEKEDQVSWDLTENGNYSNKTAWNLVRSITAKQPLINKTLNHVFSQGAAASNIWNQFGAPLGIKHSHLPIRHVINSWWLLTFPWKDFCHNLVKLQPVSRILVVCWNKPESGYLKLNTDGSFNKSNGKAGLGGALRDENGQLVKASSIPIQCTNHNIAEARAALYGVNWSIQNGHTNLVIELDSMVITEMLKDKKAGNFRLNRIIEETSDKLKHATVKFTHCYREANQLADWLAKMAMNSHDNNIYLSDQEHSNGAKGSFLLDKRQVPSMRSKFDKANFFVS